ncbi:hypothetical protein ACLKA6_015549 [Drosophila palustris]
MSSLLPHTTVFGRDELKLSAEFIGLKIPSLHVPMVAVRPPAPRLKSTKHRQFLLKIASFLCLSDILTSIYSHRVYVFKADLHADKSLLLPIIILEDSELKKSNLKIICIEKENIIASYNSKRLADFLDENVGETVGIEVPQHNSVSSGTHIVFTTANYFLRSLINKSPRSLNNISHFVVNDVHLHDPYTDILLSELKKSLTVNQNLRIILLAEGCDSQQFITFFGEGAEFSANQSAGPLLNLQISYIEDIQSRINGAKIYKGLEIYKNRPKIFRNKSMINEELDKCLQVYEELGTDASIRLFLYSVNYEFSPINYQHSFTGKTAINIAVQFNNVNHLRLLLFMGASPYLIDNQHENAMSIASARGYTECLDILNNYSRHGFVYKNAKPEFVDYDVIIDIIYLLCAKTDYPSESYFG